MNLSPYLTLYTKTNSKRCIGLNVEVHTIKLLEEITEKNHFVILI